MKLSQMKQVLDSGRIQLTKSMGQNFLHDRNQLQKIVQQAELTTADQVLEVGPGLGPLTALLVESAGTVLAIEKDARLTALLRERFAAELQPQGRLELVHGDALEYLRRENRDWSRWKLVANLPYSVASPILVELAKGPLSPARLVVTLQIEVARRIAAEPAQADYGVLSLLMQLDFVPEGWFRIPPGSFFPEPDVDSACITLRRRPEPLLEPELRRVFYSVVKRSFSQRRKMMLKLLKQDWPAEALIRTFAAAGIPVDTRAERVSLKAFAQLTHGLAQTRKEFCDA